MRKIILIAISLIAMTNVSYGKIKFGVRGGANISEMSFNKLIETKNRTGFYIGPTVKIGLPLGFDIDGSLLYNKWEADTDLRNTDDENMPLKYETIAAPLNLRKGFGLGDKASIFIFAGPQVALNIGKKDIKEWQWKWKDTNLSINLGVGAMLLNHLEVKANYNIPCGNTGSFSLERVGKGLKAKTGGWQIGMAIYF